jgi:hypothetical protein
MDRIFLRVADWEHGCALMSTRPSHSSAPGGCSKFIRCSACAVQINRHNLDLLCDDDCGGVGPVGHDASQPTRVVAGPGPSLLSTAGRGALLSFKVVSAQLKLLQGDHCASKSLTSAARCGGTGAASVSYCSLNDRPIARLLELFELLFAPPALCECRHCRLARLGIDAARQQEPRCGSCSCWQHSLLLGAVLRWCRATSCSPLSLVPPTQWRRQSRQYDVPDEIIGRATAAPPR